MRRGGKLQSIVQHITRTKEIASLKLLGIALNRVFTSFGGTCTISVLTPADFSLCGATEERIAGIVNEMNVLPKSNIHTSSLRSNPGHYSRNHSGRRGSQNSGTSLGYITWRRWSPPSGRIQHFRNYSTYRERVENPKINRLKRFIKSGIVLIRRRVVGNRYTRGT